MTRKLYRDDDPKVLDAVTKNMLKCIKGMDSTTIISVLQMNSVLISMLLQFFGMANFHDSHAQVKSYILNEFKQTQANEHGNYIEKALHERESNIYEGRDTVLASADGKQYIVAQLMDILFGGTETTAKSLEWMVLYLVKYPEYQEQMFTEISSLTGDNERPINVTDKSKAHFCNSFLDEVLRHSPFATIIPGHMTLKDEQVDGHEIPKRTQVYILIHITATKKLNLSLQTISMLIQVFCYGYGIMHDPVIYSEPMKFHPGRFLDKDGVYTKDPHLVMFGLGHRRCPGEMMGRNEYFLMTTRIVQNFKLSASNPDQIDTTDAIPGVVFSPKPFHFCAELRSKI